MRHLILLAATVPALAFAVAPVPAHAAELWCMPAEVCRDAACKPTTDEESSVRLTDPDGPAPSLRAQAETIAMTKTYDGPVQQWEGLNDSGAAEILAMQTSDMAFTYLRLHPDGSQATATGICERQ